MMATRPRARAVPWRRLALAWLPTCAVALAASAALGWVQLSFDGLLDADSYFHTRAARELDRHGLERTFPQAAFSTWSVRFADKDLLFHLALIPFQRLSGGAPGPASAAAEEDLVTPGKHAAIALTLLFFTSLGGALHAVGARHPWLWLLLYFLIDLAVLRAFVPVRPGLLGMTLFVIEIALIVRGRARTLALVSWLHGLAHSSFALLPGLVLAAVAASVLRRELPPWRVLGWGLAGVACSLVLNPYFPNNLAVTWAQTVDVALSVWGSSAIPQELFGSELGAARTDLVLRAFPGLLPAAAGLIAFLAWPERRLTTAGLGLVLMGGLVLVAAFGSERFFDFLFPVVLLLGARLFAELAAASGWRESMRRSPGAAALRAGALAVSLACGVSNAGLPLLARQVAGGSPVEALRPGIEHLRREAAPGDLVYHNFWWDFSALYHYRPQGRYVVALDPVFFFNHDAERFRDSVALYRGNAEDSYGVLRDRFGAEWVFLPKAEANRPLFERMRADPRFRLAYEDDALIIVRLGGRAAPNPG